MSLPSYLRYQGFKKTIRASPAEVDVVVGGELEVYCVDSEVEDDKGRRICEGIGKVKAGSAEVEG